MISLDKCNGICMTVDNLSTKLCTPSKVINLKVFNIITTINEATTLVNYISCNCKCKFNSKTCNSNQKWNNDTCQCKCKMYLMCKKGYSWNFSVCICENSKFFKKTLLLVQ